MKPKNLPQNLKEMNMYLGTFNISFETCVSNLVGKPGTFMLNSPAFVMDLLLYKLAIKKSFLNFFS